MNTDLRTWSDSDLTKLLNFTEELSEQEFANFGDPDDLAGAETQARDYIKRRKANTRHIDDKEDAAIRKQVRKFLKKRGIIKD